MQVELSDEELCRQVASRDAHAFDLLVERYQARAFRLARSILGNDADAHDLSQDAFIRLYESAHKFDGRSSFSTWFHRILVNLCIDQQRRSKWWRRLVPLSGSGDDDDTPPIDPASDDPGPDLRIIESETAGELRAALDRLSPNQRAAVLMQAEGLSSKEIGQVLKCSESTARVHVYRAVTELKKAMRNV